MDIRLLDHLIITNDEFYSFADEGIIDSTRTTSVSELLNT